MSQFELPDSWAFTTISEVAIKGDQRAPDQDETFTYVDIGSIDRVLKRISDPQILMGKNAPSRARKAIRNGDVLVSLTRPNLNAVALVTSEFDGQIASTGFEVIRPCLVDSRYIFGLTRSKEFIDSISGAVQGALYPAAKSSDVQGFKFPLPPLAEQKIIADKLDTLLAQVESIKARLERIPEILKQFRQSVLAAAVSGKLTEEWRRINTNHVKQDVYSIDKYWENEYKKNNKKYKKIEYPKSDFDLSAFPDSWVKTNVGRIFDVYVGATPSRQREDFWNGEINWVSSSEVAFCRIQSTKENITDEGYKSTSTTIHPIGTVMLAMIGQGKTRGQAAILDIEACHNQNTAALRIPEKIAKSEFLYFYLLYKYEETRQVGSGNNQQAMNKAIVQGLEFPLPPFKEQIEIVDKIESLFEYIERVEGQVQVALDRVNNLTQSILAKAFRGELTDEWREANPELISGVNSAEALLERIKAERVGTSVKRGRARAN